MFAYFAAVFVGGWRQRLNVNSHLFSFYLYNINWTRRALIGQELMFYQSMKHRTFENTRENISFVFLNTCRVLSQCNTQLRLLYLLTKALSSIVRTHLASQTIWNIRQRIAEERRGYIFRWNPRFVDVVLSPLSCLITKLIDFWRHKHPKIIANAHAWRPKWRSLLPCCSFWSCLLWLEIQERRRRWN